MTAYLFPTSVCTGPFQMFPAWLLLPPTLNLGSLSRAKGPERSARLGPVRIGSAHLAAPLLVPIKCVYLELVLWTTVFGPVVFISPPLLLLLL